MNLCKICNSENFKIFDSNILNKYRVSYYKCGTCDFVQTDNPFWLNEAYSSAITSQDIGLLNRNIYFAPLVSCLIKFFFDSRGKFLDYGGGYGVFVRIMRDLGFNFKRFDIYCDNLFAVGFDCAEDEFFELIVSMEVFEHLVDPLSEFENMLNKSSNIFFTTELQPVNWNNSSDWWYVMPETGQHISLYSSATLIFIAKKYNLNLYSNGKNFHLFTKKKINQSLFKLISNRHVYIILNKLFYKKSSLLWSDYSEIVTRK